MARFDNASVEIAVRVDFRHCRGHMLTLHCKNFMGCIILLQLLVFGDSIWDFPRLFVIAGVYFEEIIKCKLQPQAMEDEEDLESTVIDDFEEHFKASSSKGSHWTSIDDVPLSEVDNVRVLPTRKVPEFRSIQFQLHDLIAEGCQGKVYNATFGMNEPISKEFTTTGGHCVVKGFKGKLRERRFGQWPEELFDSHSDCQYICKFYGYFIYKDYFCLVMEKYDWSLRACIDKHMKKGVYKGRPFHGPVAMLIIIQLAIGMDYLHLLNILHRDLKADNIFIMNIGEDDDTPAAGFIGDFDISPTVVGTEFWRAPEILQGLRDRERIYNSGGGLQALPFTTKSDVYSFAMTCYEILTGRIPFEGTALRNYDVVLSGERPELPSNLNPKMKELLNKCWHQDPDARPSFTDIVSELKGFVEGTEAYIPIFNSSNVESLRLRNSSLESNFLELKDLVHVVANKYNQEDFVVWAVQFGDAIEQFKVQFGLRSFAEQPTLPPLKGLSRLKLLDTIHFTFQMFFATCPFNIPECKPLCRLMQTMVFNKIQEGMADKTIGWPDSPNVEEVASWTSFENAWKEEKQSRPQTSTLVNRHDVCHEVLTSKPNIGRNRDEACDICKHLPFYAPKSTISTFSLYGLDKHTSLARVFTWLWHIVKKLFHIGR